MKNFLSLVVMFVLLSCNSCSMVRPYEGQDVRDLTPSVIEITMTVHGKKMTVGKDGKSVFDKHEDWDKTGTGFIVGVTEDGKRSYVVSAAHVLVAEKVFPIGPGVLWINDSEGMFDFGIPKVELEVSNRDGSKCMLHLMRSDKKADIALAVADCNLGPAVQASPSEPPIGAHLMGIGSPSDFHPDGVFYVSEGRMLGKTNKGNYATSVPTTYGGSGSPVFWNGKLVSMFVSIDGSFNHLSFGVPLPIITDFLEGKPNIPEALE